MKHTRTKDTESYRTHNAEYEATVHRDPAWHAKNFEKHGFYNQYEVLGFKKIVESHPHVRKLHIDLGCGAGWLLTRTAPFFENVVGIDPSHAALQSARVITDKYPNISLIEGDMVESLERMHLTEPAFITTGTVLSHINDHWVEEVLKLIDKFPTGSILYFGEPFDKNIQRKLWYIRSKAWWAARLPHWQLLFNDHAPFGYRYGIGGLCVGSENVLMRFPQRRTERARWQIEGWYYAARTLVATALKYILRPIL